MPVVRAPNTTYFFIFALLLLPVLPQLSKEKKIKPHCTPTPKKAPNQQPKKSPNSPAVCDAIYPTGKFCKSICCKASVQMRALGFSGMQQNK